MSSVVEEDMNGESGLKNLFAWFKPETRQSTRAHILRGFSKSFLLYFVPITILRRGSLLSNLRRSLALGLFTAGVRAGDDILTKLKSESFQGNPQRPVEEFISKYTLGVAAFISALVAINIDGEIHTSITVVLWTIVRALRPFVPDIPGGAIILMCLTAAQVLSTWLVVPDEHNKAYKQFLDYHGGLPRSQLKQLALSPMDSCSIVHPGEQCLEFFPSFFLKSLPRSIQLYLPVYITSFILSSSKNIPRTLIGFIRSCLFLSLYCTSAWVSLCCFQRIRKEPMSRVQIYTHAWVAGLAVILESTSRRSELAAYCLTYALESIYNHFKEKKGLIMSPSLNALVLAISAGVLLHHHDHQPKAVMHWLFKLGSGAIRNFP